MQESAALGVTRHEVRRICFEASQRSMGMAEVSWEVDRAVNKGRTVLAM